MQNIHRTLARIVPILFSIFILGYAAIFLIDPQLGPFDDYLFLRTLQSGKPILYYSSFPYYDTIQWGRFTPLASMEYNVAALISNTPFAYYLFHAIQFIILTVVLLRIFFNLGLSFKHASGIIAYLILLPGFSTAWFHMQLTERNCLFFGALFVLAFQQYVKRQSPLFSAMIFLLANTIIYLKETAFALIGSFALARMCISWRSASRRDRVLHCALLGSALLYLLLYALIVLPRGELATIHTAVQTPFIELVKKLFNTSTFSDPLIFFGILPLFFYRLFLFCIRHEKLNAVYDALLAGAVGFILLYIFLRLYGHYYLLPAYAFALPALVFFTMRMKKKLLIAPAAIIGLLALFNTIPAAIHYITYLKYVPINQNVLLDFVTEKIHSGGHKPISLFIDGLAVDNFGIAYAVLAEYLEFRGFTNADFDLKSTLVRPSAYRAFSFIQNYAVFSPGSELMHKGDLLLVTPHSWKMHPQDNQDVLARDYTLIFQTKSPYAFPLYTARTFIKKIIAQFPAARALAKNPDHLEPVDYLVYEKN